MTEKTTKLPDSLPATIRINYHEAAPSDLDTEQIRVNKFHTLVHCRHDLLHHLVNTVLSLPDSFTKDKTLRGEFEQLLPDVLLKYSPDIVALTSTHCLIADVSCTWNRDFHLSEKKSKYDAIVEALRQSTDLHVPDFYMFWVDPSWSNLRESLENLYDYLSLHSILYTRAKEDKIEQVRIAHEDIAESIQTIRQTTPSELLYEDKRIPIKMTELNVEGLEKKASEHFSHFKTIQETIGSSTLQDVEEIFKELVEDQDVFNKLKDSRHDENMFESAFKQLDTQEEAYATGPAKPTFFIPFADFDQSISDELASVNLNDHLSDLRLEQKQVLQILTFAVSSGAITDTPIQSSLKKILEETLYALKNDGERNLFNTGMLTGNLEQEVSLNKLYTEHRQKQDSSLSKRQFFKGALGSDVKLRDTLPYIYKNKCVKLTAPNLNTNAWFAKSGTAFKKSHEVREYKQKSTIGKEMTSHMQDFMDLLNKYEDKPYKTHPFLGTEAGPDAEFCKNIKSGFLDKQKDFLGLVQHTKAHSFSKHTSTIVTQLLHFNELNTSPNTFYLMSGGRQNCIHIVRGGSLKRGQDVGQSLFTLFITHDIKWASTVYGRVNIYPIAVGSKTCFLCVTPWVRLSSTKLSFMKDQYYSTLSTAYDSWTRVRSYDITSQTLQMIYTFRVCVSLCPSQRVAELLMDTRYIVMAALSTYSNVFELIVDKFPPPYSNVLEKHIVVQLRKKCSQIVKHFRTNPPQANKPGYSLNTRLQTTLGGKITMPSLWSEEIVKDMQGLFDELFVYVHTSKEPSSNYHEQVRAMNTILKFQKQYNMMTDKQQSGTMNASELKSWIMSGNQIGCHTPTVYWGAKLWGEKFEGLHHTADFKDMCLTEPLSELESTKACIPEVSRTAVVKEKTRAEMDRVIANLGSLFRSEGSPPSPLNTYFKIDVDMSEDVEMVITQNLRVKVHDSLLDWIKRSRSKPDFTLDLALWNIFENNMRVIADTCIKAQYGAKREFYVINLGAKGMARVLENSYKCLAKRCRNEMISVPGDKKLEHIQLSVNEIILASERRQDKIFYTNGDCTKWSACETMSSFVAFNSGLKNVLGDGMTAFNNAVFSSWANKEIQIPQSILSNLKYMSDQTSYITDSTTIKSTQNFLQGMFNYASSLKAVAATEFALHMFRKLNPTDMIFCTHLEHSDDYSLVTRVKDDHVFEKFRVYHKLAQKLFGINDSTKKTNVQKYFLEFISLFSFNGQLFYPNIKKTKEVGTNLPCTNFKNDVMSVTSRTAEAVRLGVTLESCYFLQRVHCASLADAYSMTPGMKNSYGSIIDCFSTPLELFGFPDCLPVLHYVIRGSPESYRLYNFGGESVQELYKKLFVVSQETLETDDLPYLEYASDLGEFFSPNFSYPTRHNRLREIKKKLNISLEESRDYFQSNLTDTLVKPADSKRFAKWLEAMYYNKSFSQAYMSVSRATMTLRHSLFSSKPCIQPYDIVRSDVKTKDQVYYWTVKQHYAAMRSYPLTNKKSAELSKSLAFKLSICSYSQTIGMYYDFFESSRLIQDAFVDTHTTVSRSPMPYQAIPLENRVQLLLQFMINPENFYSDRRKFLSETSLFRDIELLAQNYNLDLLRKNMGYARQVMKELIAQNPPSSYGLVYNTNDTTSLGYMIQYLSYGLFSGETFRVVPQQKTQLSVLRPEKIRFARDWKSNSDTFTETLYELALIYRTIKLRCQNNFSDQIEKLMKYEIPEVGTTVLEFLQAVNLKKLLSYKVGENAQKILAFLKMALLNDLTDMRLFLNGRLFYEYHYMPKNHCPNLFDEGCTIRFQGVCCNAFLQKSNLERPIIVLELPNTNKVLWFYFYTIAERVFGLINQIHFDMRMMNTHDMALRPIRGDKCELLNSVKITSRDPTFFRMVGKVILPTTEYVEATLPIVVQKTNFSHARFSKREELNVVSSYSIEGLSVYMSEVLMYTLPFGNLYSRDLLEKKTADQEGSIIIDGIPLSLLQESGRLMSYLKSDFTQHYQVNEIEQHMELVWSSGLSEFEKTTYKIENLGEMFNLDVVKFPNAQWSPPKKKVVKDYFEKAQDVDPLDEVPANPVVFTNTKTIITEDEFKSEPLDLSLSEIGVPRKPNLEKEETKEVKKQKKPDLVNSFAGTQTNSLESFMEMFDRVSKRVKEKKEAEAKNVSPVELELKRTELESKEEDEEKAEPKEEDVQIPTPRRDVKKPDMSSKMLGLFDFSKMSIGVVNPPDSKEHEKAIEDSLKSENQTAKRADIRDSSKPVVETKTAPKKKAQSDAASKMLGMFDFSKMSISTVKPDDPEKHDKEIEQSLQAELEPTVKTEEIAPKKVTQTDAASRMLGMFDFSKMSISTVKPTDQEEHDKEIEQSLASDSEMHSKPEKQPDLDLESSKPGPKKKIDLLSALPDFSNVSMGVQPSVKPPRVRSELEERLLNTVSIDFDVEVVEGDFEVDIISTFGNVGLVHGKVSEEALLKQNRIREYTAAVNEATTITIEDIRERITLNEPSEEELGELFETVYQPHQEAIQSDKSSDDSLTNENLGYYQMVEHPSLLEQGYRFERRAREALLPLPEYLLDCWIKPDLVQMFQNSTELGNLIKLFSGLLTNAKRMNLTTKHKALIKATFRGMEKMLSSTIDPYMFSQSKAITFDNGKISFWAVASYASKEERKMKVDSNPKIKYVHGIENHTSNRYWVKAPLKQADFEKFLKTHDGEIHLQTRTRLSSMLSQLIPELKEVELDLDEDYGF